MDRPRTDQARRRRRRWITLAAIALTLSGVALALTRLKPAAPGIDRNGVWIDTVRRGEMLRQVRGIGTLAAVEISWITARTPARVIRIVLRPGAIVKPDDIILLMNDPDVREAAASADSEYESALAEEASLKLQLETNVLAVEAEAATVHAEYEEAKLREEANEKLFTQGVVSALELRLSKVTADQTRERDGIQQKRVAFMRNAIDPQLGVARAKLARLRAQAKLRHEELDALQVRAGTSGVLQELPVEEGAQVAAGTNLARVVDPKKLKAVLRIAETQARDIQLGQSASIDTRNGVIEGQVARVDPSVHEGTVSVDVTLTGPLPKGARPDLSVEGTVELERLQNVVFVGRPALAAEQARLHLFKLEPDGSSAVRTTVQIGRNSANAVEVVSGLAPGDRVILSDMSRWDQSDRIRLN